MSGAEQARARPLATLTVLWSSATFRTNAEGVRAARRYVRAAAGHSSHLHDIEQLAAELALCAACHADGATFTMTYHRTCRRLRIEATPSDPNWTADHEATTAYTYGMLIMDALTEKFGHYGASDGPSTTWAEFPTR